MNSGHIVTLCEYFVNTTGDRWWSCVTNITIAVKRILRVYNITMGDNVLC